MKCSDYLTSCETTVYVTFLDASKAFDRLNYWLLFDKLVKKHVLQRCFPLNLGDLTVNTTVVTVSQHTVVVTHSPHSQLKKSSRLTFSHRRGLFVMILFGFVPSFVL